MYTIAMLVPIVLGLWLAVSGGRKRRIVRTAAGVLLSAALGDLSRQAAPEPSAGERGPGRTTGAATP